MSDFTILREGTWLYCGRVLTGVRIVSCSVRYGSGDLQDTVEVREDRMVLGFDVQWASPTTPHDYGNDASAVFSTLADAMAYAERAEWVAATLKWTEI